MAASFDGLLTMRPNPDTRQPVTTVVVERYGGVWPGETCGAALATSPFQERYWKLTRRENAPIILDEGQREPNLVFHSTGGWVTGFGGCNNLTSAYTVKDGRIGISKVAATRMACLKGGDTEDRFLNALNKASSRKIVGEYLELYDGAGTMIAGFEARALR